MVFTPWVINNFQASFSIKDVSLMDGDGVLILSLLLAELLVGAGIKKNKN